MLHILGIGLLSVFACIGFIHAAAWLAVRLSRKGNGVYKVVPVGGEGKKFGRPDVPLLRLPPVGIQPERSSASALRRGPRRAGGARLRGARARRGGAFRPLPRRSWRGSCARGRRLPARLRFPARTAIMIAVKSSRGEGRNMELGERYAGGRGGDGHLPQRADGLYGATSFRPTASWSTVVGEFAGIAVGETLIVEGVYATHPEIRPPAQGGQV